MKLKVFDFNEKEIKEFKKIIDTINEIMGFNWKTPTHVDIVYENYQYLGELIYKVSKKGQYVK